MPTFHFNVSNADPANDYTGLELANASAARLMGARHLGEVVAEKAQALADGETVRVEVTDQNGTPLFAFLAMVEARSGQ